jgi:hypothetical protein
LDDTTVSWADADWLSVYYGALYEARKCVFVMRFLKCGRDGEESVPPADDFVKMWIGVNDEVRRPDISQINAFGLTRNYYVNVQRIM